MKQLLIFDKGVLKLSVVCIENLEVKADYLRALETIKEFSKDFGFGLKENLKFVRNFRDYEEVEKYLKEADAPEFLSFSWNEIKDAVNKILQKVQKKPDDEDLVLKIYDDELYTALNTAAMELFMDPQLGRDLEQSVFVIRTGLQQFKRDGFIKE